ncbi:hypothetical protein C8R43DRAFT_823550, partial [Mycena crocata]
LQTYLNDADDRAKWCYLADKTLQKEVPDKPVVKANARVSPFTQTWVPLQKKLPKALKKMFKSAKRFGLKFDALALSKDIKESLPTWFHIGGTEDMARHNNTKCAACLRENHGVRTVGDVLHITERNYARHSRRRNCACNSCKSDRLAGCDSPFKCQEEAVKILDCIHEKWDPQRTVTQTNKELTLDEKQANKEALAEKRAVLFDPSITLQGSRKEGFRIF